MNRRVSDTASPPANSLLAPLLAGVETLKGVKPATAKLLARVAGGGRVIDLLFHLPESVVDRRYRPTLRQAETGRVCTLHVTVTRVVPPAPGGGRGKRPWRVVVTDGTADADLVFFSPHLVRRLEAGQDICVSGTLERFGDRLNMAHPDYLVPAARMAEIPLLDPVWPLTAGLFPSQVRAAVRAAFDVFPPLPEWQDASVLKQRKWPGFEDALRTLHRPYDMPDLLEGDALVAASERARARLACDDLLAQQVSMAQARRLNRLRPGRAVVGDGSLRRIALSRFGHEPTTAQIRTLGEIDADLAAPRQMTRLLQGDVGAGKTLVALLAMLAAVEAGHQAALMAPTEILARQHLATFRRLSPVPVAFLSGSVKGKARREALAMIADGTARLVIGTHALFQDSVVFHDLALAVIDEQHRFGVEQRAMLGEKGPRTDVLVMTATPIPRSLLLTQWGDMLVSRLDVKPAGRKPVRTSLHALSAMGDLLAGMERALARGARIFWVCPLVSESETSDIAAAEARHAALCAHFGEGAVGLAHGQQDIAVREQSIADFAAGKTRILVATTVIEVGVDIPDATVMVIEHAERFGLAQLHQLRGRVGRGQAESYCLLLHDAGLGQTARRRLALLRETEDGFLIADEDFRLRGGGDLTGRRQSGLPDLRLASPLHVDMLLRLAAQDARRIVDTPPAEATPALRARIPAVSFLLELFARAQAVRAIRAG
ncbi:ATP-dependent DNA helicase RecG [Komagataeibacter sp. FXV3]|uniref:ATP-dependent DNA helicase RecG n=1 Tax=Komagataeibacter sp. FXV3 TaxID=2608998 RepID=UPI00187B75AB|nr:ATP-dependent DNA helicase RecG [Komagataeibacter sp. FXV3]MBE7729103.1 ATP-dependent DNA helicase RecG [Komagataeibacter sp. FXV3]